MSDDTASRRDFLNFTSAALLTAGLAGIAQGAEPLAPPDKQVPGLPIPTPLQKKVGYAIVGLGELALEQILPAFALSEASAPVALVSGHRENAEKVAAHYGIDPKNIYSYEKYDSLRDNPQVQVIYIVLPNSMHAEYTVRGFAAGKHVLCEKPMAPTPEECQQMIDAGKKADRKLMIAYRMHYEPYNKFMIELARKKELGPIRVFSALNLQSVSAPNIRLSRSTGGGPLGDVGIYCLNAARYITGEEPTEVFGQSWADPDDERFREVPSNVTFTLKFPSGVLAQCAAGFDTARSNSYRVICGEGTMELDPAFDYVGQRMKIVKTGMSDEAKIAGVKGVPDLETQVVLKHQNHFANEMDHFSECVLSGKDALTPGEEGLKDITILKAIERSMAEGRKIVL